MRFLLLLLALTPCVWSQVTNEDLLHSDDNPENWLTYSGNYRSERFTHLDQITKENVSRLRPAWIYQTGTAGRVDSE